MDPLTGGLIGGGVGAGIGAVGGYFQGVAADQAARDLRKQVRGGVSLAQADTIRQTAGVLGSSSYQAGDAFIRSLYGLAPTSGQEYYSQLMGMYGGGSGGYGAASGNYGYGIKGYDQQASFNQAYVQDMLGVTGTGHESAQGAMMGAEQIHNILGGASKHYMDVAAGRDALRADAEAHPGRELIRIGSGMRGAPDYSKFTADQFRSQGQAYGRAAETFDAASPLYENYSKGLNQSMAARGLNYGLGAASAEASGLAAFQTQLQLQNIGSLFSLAQQPYGIANQFGGFGGNANREVFAATGGQGVYGQTVQGAHDPGPMAGLTGALSGAAAGFGAGASIGINAAGTQNDYDYLRNKNKSVVGYGMTNGVSTPVFGNTR